MSSSGKVDAILTGAAKRLAARAAGRMGAAFEPGHHLFLAPVNWLRKEAGLPPAPFNQPSLILPHLADQPRWSHLVRLQEADLCARVDPLDRPLAPLPDGICEPFSDAPRISRLHLRKGAQVWPMATHLYRDVLFAHRGDRFCILRGDRVDAQSTALPGAAMARQLAAGRVTSIKTMAYCGDRHSPGNPAHFIADQLTRALILRDDHGVPPDAIYLPETAAPVNQAMQRALDSRFRAAQPNQVYQVEELLVCSDALGASSHGHPFHFCDTALLAQMADAAGQVAKAGAGQGDKIYLSRGGMDRRRLTNEAELQGALEVEGVATLRMETLGGADQLAAVQEARIIVAPHGGALTSIFAAAPGTRCIELFNPEKGTMAFAMIAARRGLSYTPVFGQAGRDDAWSIDVNKVLAAVRDA